MTNNNNLLPTKIQNIIDNINNIDVYLEHTLYKLYIIL